MEVQSGAELLDGVAGSPADKADLEVGDEILEVNGKSLEDATHTEVISHIHQVCLSFLCIARHTDNFSLSFLIYTICTIYNDIGLMKTRQSRQPECVIHKWKVLL
ncbi:hypothetical protein PR048_028389 [Dryococelus australis]|uniref:PDZ domain-containing protein n=1 Tax=Dryococelus australis TaxID=614101 RepID=A0ABQ9GE75_9NEOP|nr:hypothetical protein PR048_028389 [Dryococelus australis]